ncbi:MAG: S-layer homology domain-containing protein [Clostridia bacterium]|nr:S-layer homology domain-containing protein [Clostridia bacterium]
MKNLKKLMSVILTVAMLMSLVVSTSAATFTDVKETNSAYEAIEVLAALDILEGKEAGNFDPEANIKRSEFAAVICRAMNAEAAATGSAGVKFNDVAANHWAAGYINWAADAGIVNGRGNGAFDPDANVTYQEAVKMIVAAMGFAPLAENRGGYPTGYMAIANTYGIQNGVAMTPATGAASRAGVAQLVYNAFDAPLMDAAFITLSGDDEYKIYDGGKAADYERRTLLSQYHDIYKIKAVVLDTYRTDDSLIRNGKKSIELKVANNGFYKFDAADIANEIALSYDEDTKVYSFKALINDDTALDMLGYTVNAYVTYNEDGENEILAIVPDTKSVEVIAINNIGAVVDEYAIEDGEVVFEYWENLDDNKTTTVKFAAPASVKVYNNGKEAGVIAGGIDELSELVDFSSLTLLVNKADGKVYNMMLSKYEYAIVEEIDEDAMILACAGSKEYTLNPEDHDDDFVCNIYKDGELVTFAEIAEGDMLNIVADADSSEDWTFADIYVTNEVVEAAIAETRIENGETVYTIDGNDYWIADGALVGALKAGASGAFYLTIDGYIYDADLTRSTIGNYAFIIDVAETTSGFGSVWQIKLLTKDNEKVTLDARNSGVRFTAPAGILDKAYDTVNVKKEDLDAPFEAIEALVDATPVDADDLYKRFVTFKANDSELTELSFAVNTSSDKVFNYNVIDDGSKYNDKTNRFAGLSLLENTVIFNAPVEAGAINTDKIQVYTVNSLDSDALYNGFVFDVDADRAIGAALITNSMGFAGKANALAVVRSVSVGLNAAGDDSANIINFFQAGELKSLPQANEGFIGAYDYSDLTAGDVFQYTTNAAGEINDLDLVLNMNSDLAKAKLVKTADGTTVKYSVGVVADVTGAYIDLATGESYGWDLDDNGTNVLFDTAKSVSKAIKGYSSTTYIKKAKVADSKYTSDVYVVLVKTDDGVVTEVVTYKYAKVEGGIATATVDANFGTAVVVD